MSEDTPIRSPDLYNIFLIVHRTDATRIAAASKERAMELYNEGHREAAEVFSYEGRDDMEIISIADIPSTAERFVRYRRIHQDDACAIPR